MTQLIGFFLASPSGEDVSREVIADSVDGTNKGPGLHYKGLKFNLRQWEQYDLVTDTPLDDERSDRIGSSGFFSYRVICIVSKTKLIALSERRKVTDHLIAEVFDRKIFPNLRRVAIHTDDLINDCMRADGEFLVTSLHGRRAGLDRHIRSMSLYGNDVTDTNLFRDNRELFNFYSCGIGRRPALPRLTAPDDGEIVRIGNDGYVSSNVPSTERALEMMRVIQYVVQNRWVDDWVPGFEKE